MADDDVPKGLPTKSSVLITTVPKGHPKSAALRIYKDTPTRVSKCQVCEGSIPPRGQRLILVYKLPKVYQFPNGGQMWEKRSFVHPECLVRDVGLAEIWHMIDQQHKTGERQEFFQLCWDCRKRVPTRRVASSGAKAENVVFTGKNRIHSLLCDDCIKNPWWVQCASCRMHVAKRDAVRAWSGVEMEVVQGCKACVAAGQLISWTEGQRRKRLDEETEIYFWKLRDRLKEEHAPRPSD